MVSCWRQSKQGVSLMEVAVLMAVVAAAAVPIMTMQSQTLKAGASIKFTTVKQTVINNLIESASSTGRIITTQNPTGINLDTISPGGTLTTSVSRYNAGGKGAEFWYQWKIRDVSYQIDTAGNLESPSSPILVSPEGTRVFSATLVAYSKDPASGNNITPIDTFQTTLRTNKGTGIPVVRSAGIQILFDNSSSMLQMVKDDPSLEFIRFLDVPTNYKYPGMPNWDMGQYDPSIPNHSGGTVDPTNATTHAATSLGGWVGKQYQDELAKGIGYCRTSFPHLTYRYKYLNGQGPSNFPAAYGLNNSEILDPFDDSRLDLSLQRSYPSAPVNSTYPGPGVLGMPAGTFNNSTSLWGNPTNLPITSKFGRWYYMAGVVAGPQNAGCSGGESACSCKTFREFHNGLSEKDVRYDPVTGQYIVTGARYFLPATPFAMFDNAPERNCINQPLVPPFVSVDIRKYFQEIYNKNPNDADFDNFSATHSSRAEMARNGILKFLVNIEQNQLILDSGKIGLRLFNTIPSQEIAVSDGAATSQYVSLHADRPKLFEDLRIKLLSINRYGAPNGCIDLIGQTPTYDRLLAAAQELKANNSLTSRFVIMFTDGKPTNAAGVEDPGLPNQIKNMIKAEYNDPKKPIQLYNIGISEADAAQMQSWSDQTPSGASFYASNSKELDAAFIQVSLLIQRDFLLNEIARYHLGID